MFKNAQRLMGLALLATTMATVGCSSPEARTERLDVFGRYATGDSGVPLSAAIPGYQGGGNILNHQRYIAMGDVDPNDPTKLRTRQWQAETEDRNTATERVASASYSEQRGTTAVAEGTSAAAANWTGVYAGVARGTRDWASLLFQSNEDRVRVTNRVRGSVSSGNLSGDSSAWTRADIDKLLSDNEIQAIQAQSGGFQDASFYDWFRDVFAPQILP